MFKIIIFIVSLISAVYCIGELSILHHPSSLLFKGHDHVKESTLAEVYSAALGFSAEHFSSWHGMYIEEPFNLPEAIVTVVVDGVADIGQQKGHHFPLKTDKDDAVLFASLGRRVTERYPESTSNLVSVDLSNGLDDLQSSNVLRSVKVEKPKKTTHLKLTVDEERAFLEEINILNAIAKKIEEGVVKRDYVPDIFWFKVSALHALTDLYGENSTVIKEAKHLLNEAILRINSAFTKAYEGSVLISIITSDASHTRRTRSILQAKADEPTNDDKRKYNLASNYSKDYPVIFNIILWFGVVMTFAILAVCLAIGNMDPGRDSIIYRMTSTRMKKDN